MAEPIPTIRTRRRTSQSAINGAASRHGTNQQAADHRTGARKRLLPRLDTLLSMAAVAALVASIFGARSSTFAKMAQLPTPTSSTEQCKLHYTHFHLLWTIPQTAGLFLLAAPFLTSLDFAKLLLLPMIALVWTTPWDNELVKQRAWWYPHSCVLARIGYVPVEEYFFFLIQSVMTSLLVILLTRWISPRMLSTKQQGTAASLALLPALPACAMVIGLLSLKQKGGTSHRYYISMIAWWASMPLVLLWWGTRRSLSSMIRVRRSRRPWMLALLISTVYLCFADLYALRRGTWHISEDKSLLIFIASNLPIEEAIFFFATNLILVSACFTFDRVVWQCRTKEIAAEPASFAPLSPVNFHMGRRAIATIWQNFVSLDTEEINKEEETSVQKAQDEAMCILEQASKSFHTASKLLPWDLRSDLGCIYAFARAMDDFVDSVAAPTKRKSRSRQLSMTDSPQRRLDMLYDLVAASFGVESSASQDFVNSKIANVLHRYSDLFVTDEYQGTANRKALHTSAAAASALRCIVPLHLWHELLQGYATDCALGGPNFTSFADQASYAQDVAGSIGEMCVRIVLARSGTLVDKGYRAKRETELDALCKRGGNNDKTDDRHLPTLTISDAAKRSISPEQTANVLLNARRMGVALQLVNIARDVADDGRELHRCYLVLGFDEHAVAMRTNLQAGRIATSKKDLNENGTVALLGPIYEEKLKLLRMARAIYSASASAMSLLPCRPARTGLRVACIVYMSIGSTVKWDGVKGAGQRSRTSVLWRLFVAFRAVYLGV